MAANRLQWQSLLIVLLVCAAAGWIWHLYSKPVALPAAADKLASVSLASFRDGQSPMNGQFPSREQVEADIQIIAAQVKGIRTYTADEGMEFVPALAEKYDLHLIQGGWLGRDQAANAAEISRLIAQAKQYPHTIDRLMVGNEVLLRGDLTPQELIAHIDRVRSQVPQPVSYADVWAFWLKYPEVAEHVDFITVHILPYWEDIPLSVGQAHKHIVDIVNLMKQNFPNKPILIGETGWPSFGRSRGPANPDALMQALYIRQLPALAAQYGFDYNVIEAFDQRWKMQHEGTVGGEWGIWDSKRQMKFSLTEPVSAPIDGRQILLGLVLSLFLAGRVATRSQVFGISVWSHVAANSWFSAYWEVKQTMYAPSSFNHALHQLVMGLGELGVMTQAQFDALYRALVMALPLWFAPLWGWLLIVFYGAMLLGVSWWLTQLLAARSGNHIGRWVRAGFRIWFVAIVLYALCFVISNRYIDIPLSQVCLCLVLIFGLWYARHDSPDLLELNPWQGKGAAKLMPLSLMLAAFAIFAAETYALLNFADVDTAFPNAQSKFGYASAAMMANVQLMLCLFFIGLLALWLHLSRKPAKAG